MTITTLKQCYIYICITHDKGGVFVILPCIQVNKLLVDIRQFIFEIPLISLLVQICQTLHHKGFCLFFFYFNHRLKLKC